MFWLEVIVLGIIVGLIAGGSLKFNAKALPKAWWLWILVLALWLAYAFVPQSVLLIRTIYFGLLTLILTLFLICNLPKLWTYIFALGAIINAVTFALYSFKVPMHSAAVSWGGLQTMPLDATANLLLAGRFILQPWPIPIAFSIGDILIALAIVLMLTGSMKRTSHLIKVENVRSINYYRQNFRNRY